MRRGVAWERPCRGGCGREGRGRARFGAQWTPSAGGGGRAWGVAGVERGFAGRGRYWAGGLMIGKPFCSQCLGGLPPGSARWPGPRCGGVAEGGTLHRERGGHWVGSPPAPVQALWTLSRPLGYRVGAGSPGSLESQSGPTRREPTLCLRGATSIISGGSLPRRPCGQKLKAPAPGRVRTSLGGPWKCRFPGPGYRPWPSIAV